MGDIVFKIQDKELETAEAFIKKHRSSCGSKHNLTLGEYFTYTFMPTGIGTAKTIKCNLCGEEKNITDYDCW